MGHGPKCLRIGPMGQKYAETAGASSAHYTEDCGGAE